MRRAWEAFGAHEVRLAAALLVAMVALIFVGGVARMVGHPINWAIDLATACFAWACFLAADVAWRRNGLMSVNVLVERLPAAAQRACRVVNLLLIAAFLAYVVVMGAWLAWTSRARSFQGMDVSYSWVTMSAPLGALLLLATAAVKLQAAWRGEPPAAELSVGAQGPRPDVL